MVNERLKILAAIARSMGATGVHIEADADAVAAIVAGGGAGKTHVYPGATEGYMAKVPILSEPHAIDTAEIKVDGVWVRASAMPRPATADEIISLANRRAA